MIITKREEEEMEKKFIAYEGVEIDPSSIYTVLGKEWGYGVELRTETMDNLLFIETGAEPILIGSNLFVKAYNLAELSEVCRLLNFDFSVNIYNASRIMCKLQSKYKTSFFKKFGRNMHFCSVFWDNDDNSLVAGVTTPNSSDTHLYYGYTEHNHEIMFSNDRTILKSFCREVKEMEENTYMKNGELYNFNDEKISTEQKTFITNTNSEEKIVKKPKPFIENTNSEEKIIKEPKPFFENTSEYASALINSINRLLLDITDKSVRTKIEQNIEDYLSSDDPKKKISDFLVKELDSEVQKQILEKIKNALETHNLEERIDSQLEDALDNKLEETLNNKLEEYTNKIQMPVTHIIKLKDIVLGQTSGGYYHEKFEQLLTQVQLDEPIMLIGPAGSGKNVCISQVAEALGQHMYYTNNASNEFKLTGFIDAGGNYRDTEFYKAFKNGGIFFLDEIDNSDPSALIVINSALANGYMAFPHETIDRHPDFRIIAAANTWGKGADLEYVGRNALDAATLDRFDNIFFDYDTKLEQVLYPSDEVLEFMWSFRNAVYQSKIPHIVSTRGIGKVYKKEINEIPVEDILTSNVVKNLGQDDVNTIIGNMENIRSSNTYYYGIRRLKLGR